MTQLSIMGRSRSILSAPSVMVVVAVIALVGLTLAWTIGPLAGVLDPVKLAEQAARLRDWPPAPLAVVVLFIGGNLVAMPSTLMIATTVLLFGPWRGAAYAYAGMLASGSVIYAIGRFAARGTVERWLARLADARLGRFHEQVTRHGFVAVALLRLTPIPYPLQSVALGAARIAYGAFVVGTALGIVPVILLFAGIATPFEAWIASPDLLHAALLAAACVVLVGVVCAFSRWLGGRS